MAATGKLPFTVIFDLNLVLALGKTRFILFSSKRTAEEEGLGDMSPPQIIWRRLKMAWVCDPHSGGAKIPEQVRQRTERRILAHANKLYTGKFTRIEVRFRKQFCYVDAFTDPGDLSGRYPEDQLQEQLERLRNTPLHLIRLRYFGDEERWSLAFFAYSSEKYEPSFFPSGEFQGTLEDAFDVGAIYLQG